MRNFSIWRNSAAKRWSFKSLALAFSSLKAGSKEEVQDHSKPGKGCFR